MTADGKSYYQVLQIDPAAEQAVVDAAYRGLARKYHPDVDKSPDATRRMQEINQAYAVLSDPTKRADYDRECYLLETTRHRAGSTTAAGRAASAAEAYRRQTTYPGEARRTRKATSAETRRAKMQQHPGNVGAQENNVDLGSALVMLVAITGWSCGAGLILALGYTGPVQIGALFIVAAAIFTFAVGMMRGVK